MARIPVQRVIDIEADAVNGVVVPYQDRFVMIATDSRARRLSYFHELDHSFAPIGEPRFLERGIEDHRVVVHGGQYYVWGSWGDGTQMRFGRLDPAAGTVEMSPVVTDGFGMALREKNWCPFVCDGRLFVVYRRFPTLTILELVDGVHRTVFEARSHGFTSWALNTVDLEHLVHFGGGSNLVARRGHLVGTFHAKYPGPRYAHHLMVMRPDHEVVAIADIDYGSGIFTGERLERLTAELRADPHEREFFSGGYRRGLSEVAFSTGLFLQDDRFHLSVGVNDLVTRVAVIDAAPVDRLIDEASRVRRTPRSVLTGLRRRLETPRSGMRRRR